jgi:heme ABC exporter ATP-binding subunit CcmA
VTPPSRGEGDDPAPGRAPDRANAPTPPGPAVAVRSLVKRYGALVALAGVDLDVHAGRVLAVLGPNGAGKTTLLRLLAGLARPTRGSVRVEAAGGAEPRRSRGVVGYIGHATLLYPALTARENLVFAARLYGVAAPHARADALLAEQDLAAVADRPAGACSRGLAQRLAIARGLVHDPPVVLLDEPFTGLDPTSAERLAVRLRRLAGEGRAVLLVTHDLAQAAALGDRALLLARGRIVFDSGDRPARADELADAWRRAAAGAA